jgi:uncharacterized membrane protein YkoI
MEVFMRTRHVVTLAFSTLLMMTVGPANAGEKKLHKDQVPKEVIAAFEKAYPNAKHMKFEEETFEGKPAYEVEYKENGKEHEVMYSADGTLVQKEEKISHKSLPESVAQAIEKEYPKAKIKEVEKVMKPDNTVTGYEVEIKTNGKEKELELDTNGNILKTEED